MSKDGRVYRSADDQIEMPEILTGYKGGNLRERALLKRRLLHKWMGK